MTKHTIVKAAGVKIFVKQVLLPKGRLNAYPRTIAEIDGLSERYGFRVSTNPAEWPEKLQRRELI
jgi:hypothetical protein